MPTPAVPDTAEMITAAGPVEPVPATGCRIASRLASSALRPAKAGTVGGSCAGIGAAGKAGDCRDRRRRRIEGRILSEDARFQVAQQLAGVDPQFLIERKAQPVVYAKRIGLSAVAVQREHELCVDLLIQRMIGHQLFQIGHQVRMLPGGQPGLGQGPLDLQPEQIQPLCLLLQPGQTGHIGQRPPAPQRQRGLQLPRAVGRIS